MRKSLTLLPLKRLKINRSIRRAWSKLDILYVKIFINENTCKIVRYEDGRTVIKTVVLNR